MSIEDKDNINKIEEIKKKIFSKSYKTEIKERKGFDITKREQVKDSWEQEEEVNKKTSNKNPIFKILFILSIVFFIFSTSYFVYTFFLNKAAFSNQNIDISIIGNNFANGGEELPLLVEIVNRNKNNLEFADLIIEYEKGVTLENQVNKERMRQSLGPIKANQEINQKVNLVLFGEKDSIQEINFFIEYSIEGSNAIFIKEKLHKVTINSSPINFLIDSPSEISPNQELSFKIKTILNDIKAMPDLLIKVDYPLGFEFVSSNPSPSINNNVWDFTDFSASQEKTIEITGRMVDVYDGEEKIFYIYSGTQKRNDKSEIGLIFNSFAHNISIKKPFIEALLFVGGNYKKEYAVSTKDVLFGSIHWSNNLNTSINDLEIRAKFKGNIFNSRSVSTKEGFFDSLENTIIWDKNTKDDFREVKPKGMGVVNFNLRPNDTYSLEDLIDPFIEIEVSVLAKNNTTDTVVEKLENIEIKIIKLISDVSLVNKVFYGPKNTGPYPPKAEEETTYTVIWSLANTFNNVSQTKVRATLSPRVDFKNVIHTIGEDVSFNSTTREIVWNVGKLQRGTGIATKSKEVSFEVSYTPSLSEVGNEIDILGQSTVTAFDDFAKAEIKFTKQRLRIQGRILE